MSQIAAPIKTGELYTPGIISRMYAEASKCSNPLPIINTAKTYEIGFNHLAPRKANPDNRSKTKMARISPVSQIPKVKVGSGRKGTCSLMARTVGL